MKFFKEGAKLTKHNFTLVLFSILLLILSIQPLGFHLAMAAQVDLSEKAVEIREQIDVGSMRRDIARLTSLTTRVTGYEEAEDASKYIFDRFVEVGLEDVDSREFEITVPIDEGGTLTLLSKDGKEIKNYKINSIWPNLVRTSFISDGVKHRVLEGETLENIAQAYGVEFQSVLNDPRNAFLLQQSNDGRDNDGDGDIDEEGEVAIVPGNKLFIHTGGLEGPLFYCGSGELSDFNGKDIGGIWYRVQPGDTLNDVAYRHRIGPSSIMDDVLNAHLLRTDDNIDNDEDGEVDEEGEMAPFNEIATWDDDRLDNDNDGTIDEIAGDNTDGIDNDKDGNTDEEDEFVEASESEVFAPRSSIVLINFENSGTKWINATMLGARVVIFIEPKASDTIRGEAENKFLTVPANIPRFWISRKDADEIKGILGEDGGIQNEVRVRITAQMNWQKRIGQNIRGFLEGSDPQLKDELVIIEAYYDSMSVVPAISPGADPTGGVATLLELARLFKKEEFRPARSMLFLANSGHFQGLAGMRAFMEGISQDSVRYMEDLRRDIYRDLFVFEELSRKIVLAIDRGYLVDLPPSFFDQVDEVSENLASLSTTLSDLGRTLNNITSLENLRRDETEKRKKKGETIKKREKERFTPEEQERLNANIAKYKKDALQTTNFLREIVDQMSSLQDFAITESRRAEKELVVDVALPMANLDVWVIEQLIQSLNNGEIGSTYSRVAEGSLFEAVKLAQENEFGNTYELAVRPGLQPSEQVLANLRKLSEIFYDWEMSDKRKFVLQYSQYKILDRHLTLREMERLKKARKTLANAQQTPEQYTRNEQQLLSKAYNGYTPKAQKVDSDAQLILSVQQQLEDNPLSSSFNKQFSETLRYYLSADDLGKLEEARKELKREEKGSESLEREQMNIINLALRNARREGERLNTLQQNSGTLNREYIEEEKLALKHYLSDEEFRSALEAREHLFAKFEEDRLILSVLSRAKNDIADLKTFLNQIDTLEVSLNNEQKQLLRNNLTTLRNSRIRNVHQKIDKMSRFNQTEMRRKIKTIAQAIELQSDLNRYYTSLFISIDLSTQSHEFAVFNKGWFYDQQPDFTLRREFAPIGNKLAEYADNADFGKRIKDLWTYTDDQIRQSVLANQWTIASNMEIKKAIEGKTLETLVTDYYDTLIGLSGVSRLMKLQFEQMKNRGEPSKDMLKDMDYIRKEVERFIRNDIRTARKNRKSQIRLFSKLDQMLTLRGEDPEALTEEEVDDITTLISIVGLGGTTNFVNAISATGGKTWQTYIPGKIAFDSEVATLSGMTGIAFATINDARVMVDTPLDTFNNVNFDNLEAQATTLASVLIQALTDPQMPTAARVGNFYCSLYGDVVEFDAKESAIPEKPIPSPIIAIRRKDKTLMGVRGDLIVSGDNKGIFEMVGLAMEWRATRRPGGRQEVEAYVLDKDSGDIVYAPDRGGYGAKMFSNLVPINTKRRGCRIVVFPCVSTTIYDLVDQRYLRTLRELSVYDADTDGEPQKYGFSKPWSQRGASQESVSSVEPIALIYSEPGARIKAGMSYGVLGKRLLLIKASKLGVKNPTLYTGEGFVVRENGSIRLTPYVVVRDMWYLDENRSSMYKSFGISSNRLDQLHDYAWEQLTAAKKALVKKDYSQAMKLARAAWGFESRAYPDVKDTGNDVVKGVMFYLAILMPFAYFMERLLFSFPSIHKQIGATTVIFMVVFALLSQIHPAFKITFTPIIILLAFVVLALTGIVIYIIVQKFEEELDKMKRETSKVYKADVGRLSASAAAFSLGVNNMRKRRGRTILTCATLVILTFTVISFTSVRTFMRPNRTNLPSVQPRYTGFLIRDQYWRPLEEPVLTSIMNDLRKTSIPVEDKKTKEKKEIKVGNAIAPRAWYQSSGLGEQSFVKLVREMPITDEKKEYTVNMLVGMSADEPQVTRIDKYLRYGRWFEPDETYACVLPNGVANSLGIEEADVGTAKIKVYGADFTVVGVLGIGFKDLKDNDGEELTPVDYQIMQQQRARGLQGDETLEGELQKYLHLTPDSVAILPYEVVMNQGGDLKSVAVNMGAIDDTSGLSPAEKLDLIMGPLMNRIALDFFVGKGRDVFLYSSIGMTSFSGMSNLFIPILIAALIVLNTMLGAVYERVREISIYSSVGLAPVHIAFLFIAEACVYAIIGAVFGYLLGQTTSWVLVRWELLVGLTLNYSSMSTVTSTIIVMLVVLGSTIYPAIKASRMAVPDIERKWKLPEPDGDEWHFDLPFTVLGEEALGLNIFMRDYFEAHADESASDFYTDQVTFSRRQLDDGGEEYSTSMMVWLAPYDLGVSQQINLIIAPAGGEEEDLFRIFLNVHRESGEIASWKRVNRRFLNLMRKQLLIWRTFNVEVRGEFHERGRQEIEQPGAPQMELQPAD